MVDEPLYTAPADHLFAEPLSSDFVLIRYLA
jgi:hypothetical protein